MSTGPRPPRRSDARPTHRSGPRLVHDSGQATVEFALGLPLVCLLALGVVQVAVVALHRFQLESIARTAARAAAVAEDPAAAAGEVARSGALQPLMIDVDIGRLDGASALSTPVDVVTVDVAHTDPTDVPLVGLLVPDAHLDATATMPLEPP